MTARALLALTVMLSGCVPAAKPDVATRASLAQSTLPPMKTFATAPAPRPSRANADLVLDFMELSMQMESGRKLPVFTRFESPITLAVTGAPPATLGPDLARLLARLRREAGLDIKMARPGQRANITIEAVRRAEIHRVLPQAACFVAPNVSSLRDYRSARRSPRTDWTTLRQRERLAIFLPNDANPQEVRDCLHEELAQALGPLNDLYRLPDSVFNDDNVHTVLTGFDMLILRAYYDPALRSGMSAAEVAAALPGIFARLNPAGETLPGRFATRTPQGWTQAIQTALGRNVSQQARESAAREAVRIATAMGWQDHRRAFAHYAMGRVLQAGAPETAHHHYLIADGYYAASPGTALHRAYVGTQLAAYAISQGEARKALRIIGPHVQNARASENAALLATLLLLRAEALDLDNRSAEARSVRLDSIGWARYGFGPDWAVRAKLREIAALNPLKK